MISKLINLFKKNTKNTPKIIDFSHKHRVWGHDFDLFYKLDEEGVRWKVFVWVDRQISIGDFLLLGVEEKRTVCYEVESIKKCKTPSDMYFLTVKYRPYREIKKFLDNNKWIGALS